MPTTRRSSTSATTDECGDGRADGVRAERGQSRSERRVVFSRVGSPEERYTPLDWRSDIRSVMVGTLTSVVTMTTVLANSETVTPPTVFSESTATSLVRPKASPIPAIPTTGRIAEVKIEPSDTRGECAPADTAVPNPASAGAPDRRGRWDTLVSAWLPTRCGLAASTRRVGPQSGDSTAVVRECCDRPPAGKQ